MRQSNGVGPAVVNAYQPPGPRRPPTVDILKGAAQLCNSTMCRVGDGRIYTAQARHTSS